MTNANGRAEKACGDSRPNTVDTLPSTIDECLAGRKCPLVASYACRVVLSRPYNLVSKKPREHNAMSEHVGESDRLKKAIVQKLESLHRAGVRSFPRTEFTTAPAKAQTQQAKVESSTPPKSKTSKSAGASAAPSTAPSAPPAAATSGKPNQPSLLQLPDNEPFSSPSIPVSERAAVLEVVSNEVSACTRCSELATSRTQTVFGVGNPNARLVFFGEAPGADEDRLGEPFVGKAGQLLTKIIEACTLKRDDVYIMNVLRCRPPGNRNPTPEEAQNCRPFFEKQFEIIRPEFVCCLGSVAATTLLNTTASVGRLRGKLHDWRGMRVAVTYHPAYLLRNASAKKHVWADMKMLMKEMGIEL